VNVGNLRAGVWGKYWLSSLYVRVNLQNFVAFIAGLALMLSIKVLLDSQ
jgi:hypothetical protein